VKKKGYKINEPHLKHVPRGFDKEYKYADLFKTQPDYMLFMKVIIWITAEFGSNKNPFQEIQKR
jgi:hypothetical protein